MLYQNIESVLKFKGGLCAPFEVQRGFRQGPALSEMLYAICLEPMLQNIWKQIRGSTIPGFKNNIILSSYADDAVAFANNPNVVTILERISKAFSVGKWCNSLALLPQNLTWKKEGFIYLEVYLGNDTLGKCGRKSRGKVVEAEMAVASDFLERLLTEAYRVLSCDIGWYV